jgi:phenylacetic acid degradation operon negative regulatory protein
VPAEEVRDGALAGTPPRALIVSVYGLYARRIGGWLGVGALVRLLAPLGVDDSAVRSAVSRLKRRGLLIAEEVGGAAGYALSDRGRAILDEGDRRIFARPHGEPASGWLLAVFSVPEAERDQRHRLRSQLTWLGFGTVSAGVWVAPAHLEEPARAALESSALSKYVDLFRADYVAFRPEREQVASWWDLDGLETMYEQFVSDYGTRLARWRRRRRDDDAEAFADYVDVVTHWRRLPFLDPGLPPELLPARWRGAQAADIFFELHTRLAPAAQRFVDGVLRPQSGRTA